MPFKNGSIYQLLTICFLVTGSLSFSYSQNHEYCGFEHKRQLFLQNFTNQSNANKAESEIQKHIALGQAKSSDVYNIPVVVHVLHLGEAIGIGTNISDAQIQSSINHLNQFYRGLTSNSPVDFEIEFSLAQQDPNCNATTGINRIDASSVPNYSTGGVDYYSDGGEADEDVLKDLSRWSETDYFNIWIVSEIENNNGGSGIQGYANFFAGNAYEGSMMMYNVFGYDPNNQQSSFSLKGNRDNSTVSHEFGHYLHLHHTFKGDGDADNNYIGDNCPLDQTVGVDSDGCADTDPHKRYTSQCKSGQLNDCTGAIFNDNTAKNIMSYSSCQDRLTNDQKTRARAMLSTTGISLIYSTADQAAATYSGSLASINCSPQTAAIGLSGGYGGIMNFTINNQFSNSSSYAANDGGYLDLTSECLKVIQLYEDSTYNFNISTWFNAHDIKGYIDFNNDGDFNDAGENIFNLNTPQSTSANNLSTVGTNITIPSSNGTTILSNTPVRLRLCSDLLSVTGPCHAPDYGQVEDYLLIINQPSISCNEPTSLNAANISQTSSDLSWTAGGTESVWELIWGIQGFNTGSGTLVPMLTNNSYNLTGLSANTAYDFYVKADCGFGSSSSNLSSWAGPYSFTTSSVGCSPTSSVDVQTACNSYTWINGITYTNSNNTATQTLTNAAGCDSIITLDLTITSSLNGTAFHNACDSFTWIDGITYTNSNNSATFLTSSVNGCDSLITLNLTINNSFNSQDTISACDQYQWNNNTYTSSGYYIDTLSSMNGCDSISSILLSINNSYSDTLNSTACDFLLWEGITYTSSGIYTKILSTSQGCDSVVALNLTINNSYSDSLVLIECDSYNWNNQLLNSSGIYVDSNLSVSGCDSLRYLDLTIKNSSNDTLSLTVCDTLVWNNNTYTSSGYYSNTYQNINSCDSIVTINLSINGSNATPLNLELTLDDFCLETFWKVTDSQDSIWYQEGPFNCLPNGGGPQANDTLIFDIYLPTNECYSFTLHDQYGDGMSASNFGGNDGSWILTDFSGGILMQGSGNFGDSVSTEFFVSSAIPSSVSEIKSHENIRISPNPFNNSTQVKIEDAYGPFELEIIDMNGKVVKQLIEIENNFILDRENISPGIYCLTIKNQPNLKPLKLVVE